MRAAELNLYLQDGRQDRWKARQRNRHPVDMQCPDAKVLNGKQACKGPQQLKALLASLDAHMRHSLTGTSGCCGAEQRLGELSWLCQPVFDPPTMHTLSLS